MKSRKIDYDGYKEVSNGLNAEKPHQYGFGHLQALLLFTCCTVNFMVNTHLSVTIVAMTLKSNRTTALNNTEVITNEIDELNVSIINGTDEVNKDIDNDSLGIYRSYSEWSKSKQDIILLSLFVGTGISILPGSILVQKFGGKLIIQITYLIIGLSSFILPWLVLWGGWQALCACRVLQGLAVACLFPANLSFIGKWIPVSERGTINSFIITGVTVGTILGYQVSGLLAGSSAGWPMTLWVTGGLCIIVVILVTIYGADTPSQSKYISKEEKDFISRCVENNVQSRTLPWRSMVKSKEVWASISGQVGTAASYIFCLTQVPTYMNHVLNINVTNSGLLSSLPFVVSFFTGIGCGYISDYLVKKEFVSLRNTRRLFNTLGNIGIAVCLTAVTFTDNVVLAVTLFIMSMGSYVATYSGWLVNYIDLSPKFGGTLLSAGSVIADVAILMLPSIVQHIITDTTNRYQWRIVFLIVSVIGIVSSVIFAAFMSADVQPWNGHGEIENQEEDDYKEKFDEDKYIAQ